MMWTDADGHHFIVGGIHYVAPHKPAVKDWTQGQQTAANTYLMIGYLAVIFLLIADAVFIWLALRLTV